MRFYRYSLMAVFIASSVIAQQPAAQTKEQLTVVVREGHKAVNILDGRPAVQPVVEIQDEAGTPVGFAHVTFELPRRAPRTVFNGNKSFVAVTAGSDGRAAPGEMHPIGVGSFEIIIRATQGKRTGGVTITQTNVAASEAGAAEPAQSAQANASLKIEILDGDDGVNIIDKGTAVKPIVRIVDRNNLPVAGVAVAFAIIATRGSKAEFPDGKATAIVTTDTDGRAEASTLKPTAKGPFQIQVQVNSYGQIVTATVAQTNYPTELAALNEGKFPGTSKMVAAAGNERSVNRAIEVKVIDSDATSDNQQAKPAVEVRDSEGRPVAGAQVAFLLPATGPGGLFPNGLTYMIVTTDANGRAEVAQLSPRGKGSFAIKVIAYYQGGIASTAIPHINPPAVSVRGPTQTSHGIAPVVKVFLAIGIVAASVSGVVLSQSKSGSSSSGSGGGVHIGIGVGTPSVGPPR